MGRPVEVVLTAREFLRTIIGDLIEVEWCEAKVTPQAVFIQVVKITPVGTRHVKVWAIDKEGDSRKLPAPRDVSRWVAKACDLRYSESTDAIMLMGTGYHAQDDLQRTLSITLFGNEQALQARW